MSGMDNKSSRGWFQWNQSVCGVQTIPADLDTARVAQICNLPYRRLAVGRTPHGSTERITNPRYGRLQVCATNGAAAYIGGSIKMRPTIPARKSALAKARKVLA